MQKLREVCGDNVNETQSPTQVNSQGSVTLDEQTITRSELDARREDNSVRIVEVGQDEYKTLHRLRG